MRPGFSGARAAAVARKEVRHILRDWQTLMIVIAMPVIMMFLYGYALTTDLREVRVLVENPSGEGDVNRLAAALDATPTFAVMGIVPVVTDAREAFRTLRVKAILRFPAGFSRDLRDGGRPAPVQVVVDGTDPNTATILRNLFEPLLRKAVLDLLGVEPPQPVQVRPRFLYNPQQKSSFFFVPGLMAVILMMISALLTSLTLTRERELGTMEQLLVSPLRPAEVVAGKLFPYLLLAALDGLVILVLGRLSFGVEVRGSPLFLAGAMLLYISTALALGILISTVAKNQGQAMMMVLPATMLPTIILSGFIFPIRSMAWPLQWISCLVPATWFLQVIRGIILKGVGPAELWRPLLVLSLMTAVLVAASIRRFRTNL